MAPPRPPKLAHSRAVSRILHGRFETGARRGGGEERRCVACWRLGRLPLPAQLPCALAHPRMLPPRPLPTADLDGTAPDSFAPHIAAPVAAGATSAISTPPENYAFHVEAAAQKHHYPFPKLLVLGVLAGARALLLLLQLLR